VKSIQGTVSNTQAQQKTVRSTSVAQKSNQKDLLDEMQPQERNTKFVCFAARLAGNNCRGSINIGRRQGAVRG
jgi:hypothetical protein